MQSKQEELAKLFCELATGAPFVFVPEKYGKARGQREPADLIWACNGCVVLIYLCRKRTVQRAQEHNFKQAKGWLRAWRDLGQVLRGSNRYGEIAIKIIDIEYPHIVILSVIECEDATAEYHNQETTALGVTMFVTVPLNVIQALAARAASMLDILRIIEWLRIRFVKPIPEAALLTTVESYCATAWRDSGANKLWNSHPLEPQRLVIDQFLFNLRALELPLFTSDPSQLGKLSGPHEWTPKFIANLLPTARWFADITMTETLCIMGGIKTLLDAFQARLSDPTRPPQTTPSYYQYIPLAHYDVTLHAINGIDPPDPEKDINMLLDFKKKHDRAGMGGNGPSLIFFVVPPAIFVNAIPLVPPQQSPSATELFLNRSRAQQYPQAN